MSGGGGRRGGENNVKTMLRAKCLGYVGYIGCVGCVGHVGYAGNAGLREGARAAALRAWLTFDTVTSEKRFVKTDTIIHLMMMNR